MQCQIERICPWCIRSLVRKHMQFMLWIGLYAYRYYNMKIQLLFVFCFLINFFSLKSSARENYSEFLYQRSAWETDNHIHNDTTSVVGIVLDIQYRPIESAVVVLMRSDTTHVEAVITNKNGEFVFSKHISPYLLTVQHIAYKSFMVRSDNVSTDTIILEEK